MTAETSFVNVDTPRDLIEPFIEPAGLDYFNAPLAVTATPLGDGSTIYDLSLDHPSLGPDDFLNFLHEIAPSKDKDGPAGINADWDIVDSPLGINRYNDNLVRLHQHLGSAWEDFKPSRPVFMRVLTDAEPARFLTLQGVTSYDEGPKIVPEQDLTLTDMVEQIAKQHGTMPRVFETVAEYSGVRHPRQFVLNAITAAVNQKRQNNVLTSTRSILRQYGRIPTRGSIAIFSQLFDGLPEPEKNKLMAYAKLTLFQSAISDDGTRYFIPRSQIEGNLEASIADARVVRSGRMIAKLATVTTLDPRRNYTKASYSFIVPGSIQPAEKVSTIMPRLKWIKKLDGTRDFILGDAATSLSDTPKDYEDNVMGVLLAAYFAPEVRSRWPESMSIKGSNKQEIGAAQVPVLALFPGIRKQLLNSQFIRIAETKSKVNVE